MSIDFQLAEEKIGNKFDLVLIAAQRVREIHKQSEILDRKSVKPTTQAFNDIASGLVGREYLRKVRSRAQSKKNT